MARLVLPISEGVLPLEMVDDVVIVHAGVELMTDLVNPEQFGRELLALVEPFGCRRIIVNLKALHVVTSAVMGKMITMHRTMQRHQGVLIFCNLQEAVENVLRTSRLNTYLQIALDVRSSLAALQKSTV
jgi:anti-anti-sigma factor